MGLLLRPNPSLLRVAAGATTGGHGELVDLPVDRSIERGRVVAAGDRPSDVRVVAPTFQPRSATSSTTMQRLLRLSRLHRRGELSDRDFTVTVNRLLGT